MRLLVTGATGFVGRALLPKLSAYELRVLGRTKPSDVPSTDFFKAPIDDKSDYSHALEGVDCVIHLAARVHVMAEKAKDPLAEFCAINRDGTLNLARCALRAGVKRFIFISTIKVNGESTGAKPFAASDKPSPQDPYAVSKFEAEEGLRKLTDNSQMGLVIIRPPLIYGPGVGANFEKMIRLVETGFPLPFASVTNKRSLLALNNLVDFILACVFHKDAAGKTFLISDGKDLSTAELLTVIAHAKGKKARLFSFPQSLLYWGARLFGFQAIFDRLCGSLQVDVSLAKAELNWEPKVTMDAQLKEML